MIAKVIIDIANTNVDRLYSYCIPCDMTISPGQRVLVPFGRGNKPTEGFVILLTEDADVGIELKSVIRPLENYTVLLDEQLALAAWISRAYRCTKADALRIMIPAKLRGARVKEKTVRTIRLDPNADVDAFMTTLCKKDGTPKAPKQVEVLDLVKNCGLELTRADINSIIPGAASALNALVKKSILIETDRETYRDPFLGRKIKRTAPFELLDDQRAALDKINSAPSGSVLLLHGVTGSGKTEVYMQAISSALSIGGGAIVLVPEISLTPQTTDRFRGRFGDTVAVLHSHLSDGERFDEWRRIRFSRARVVVGARSAVFAPIEGLKLIIIDEEHEPSYQSEITPKYSAVEVAKRRAAITGARLLLGSATPSLTSYYRAKRKQYTLLEMPNRINGVPMPRVDVVDMRTEFLAGNNSIFSKALSDAVTSCVERGEQAILFLNRRGYSSHAECRACGFVFTCRNCDVALTYHKYDNTLRCHYCGEVLPMPRLCPECGSEFIKYMGIGTQQVEEQLKGILPNVKTLRMDTDTTSGKNAHRDLLDAFTRGEADVLIGTQMVAKGLDIPNVTLVGVVFADSTLFHSDYRSSERTFQLLTQVAGRAGRAEKEGRVIIQTNAPEHRAIALCTKHDYIGFYNIEIGDRMHTLFPPFSFFVRSMFVSRSESAASKSAERFAETVSERLLAALSPIGAEKELLLIMNGAAPIKRRDGEYRYAVIIKLLRSVHSSMALDIIFSAADEIDSECYRGTEVNPQDML